MRWLSLLLLQGTAMGRGYVRTPAYQRMTMVVLVMAGLSLGTARPREDSLAQTSEGWEVVEGSVLENLTTDRDGDSVLDEREIALGTNPELPDTDHDGFSDLFEDSYRDFGFDPLIITFDYDNDGLSNAFEMALTTSPTQPDTDGDGWSDLDEVLNEFFGYDPLTSTADEDRDGLADSLEGTLGTSAKSVDSDGDGASDFDEYSGGLDPTAPGLSDSFGELIGSTISPQMQQALEAVQQGASFPTSLAGELPYPDVTEPLVAAGTVNPSAALIQRAVFNPAIPAPLGTSASSNSNQSGRIYDDYNQIVAKIRDVARQFDGNPGPRIVRLFRWSQPTDGKRSLFALKISDNPQNNEQEPEILYMGLHHSYELITASITMKLVARLTGGYGGDARVKKIVDSSEIWIIPVVNPDGYEKAVKNQKVFSRKNTRKVAPTQKRPGIDLNRNYGFEHVTSLSAQQRANLSDAAKRSNGLNAAGALVLDKLTYPGPGPFSEVETKAVRGLAQNSFSSGNEVASLKCSLSWHSYGGLVGHPMAHTPVLPGNTSLSAADRKRFNALSATVAKATGYQDIRDTFENMRKANGDPYDGYPAFGDSDDWLYKEKAVFALLVEAYSVAEGAAVKPTYFPKTEAKRETVAKNNVKGALALAGACLSDFGDAPDPHDNPPQTPQGGTPGKYPSRPENEGARHLDFGLEYLGQNVDGEDEPDVEQDTVDSDQDGLDGDLHDDGVEFSGLIVPDEQFSISVTVSVLEKDLELDEGSFRYDSGDPEKRLYLNAWADWNGDGVWETPGEKIIGVGPESFAINPRGDAQFASGNSGTYEFNLVAPPEIAKNLYFRFRLDYGEDVGEVQAVSTGLLQEKGAAQFGEVEDYRVPQLDLIAVGGIVDEIPDSVRDRLEAPGSSGGNAGVVAGAIAGAIAAGAVALGGAAWYARRRLR